MSVGVGLANPKAQFLDDNGTPLANGTVNVYVPGTTTPRDTYSDSTLATPNANPVVLDAAGRATIYFNPALSYKIVVKTSAAATVYTQDNIAGSEQVGLSVSTDGTTWTGRVTASTTQAPSVGASSSAHTFDATMTKAGSGTHPGFSGVVVNPPTINGGGATVTTAATLVVNGAPSGGASNLALLVQGNGTSQIQGPLSLFTDVNQGISFSDARVTGAVAGTITAYLGPNTSSAGFQLLVTSDDPLYMGSNNINMIAVRPSGAIELLDPDVAHGMTDQATTTAWAAFFPFSGTEGGAGVRGLTEGAIALALDGYVTTATAAPPTTASTAPIMLNAALKSGTTVASLGANRLIAVIRDNGTTRFAFDSDGDSHQDVGTAWTNFDTHDDIQALESLAFHVSREEDPFKEPIRQQMAESLTEMLSREAIAAMRLASFGEDGHTFVNMSKLAMLHTGALRQIGRQVRTLAAENVALRIELGQVQARLSA